jgi:prefoldin subunit 5
MEVNERNAMTIDQKLKDLQSQVDGLQRQQTTMEGMLRTLAGRNEELQSQLLNMQASRMGHGPTA